MKFVNSVDQRFVRTLDYYLAYSEAAFRERHIGDVQIVMTKNNNVRRLPGDPASASSVRTLAGAAR
ncbi:MAG: hypothetical protein JWN34_6080 [Bryobacterales bacterium]|jgi:hypothetical protein|nr:hypothetical protein [Bryobacterales bacterium]